MFVRQIGDGNVEVRHWSKVTQAFDLAGFLKSELEMELVLPGLECDGRRWVYTSVFIL